MAQENWNPESTKSQKAQVKDWLSKGKSITPMEALEMFGCMRLAAVVFELRDEGMAIETEKYLTPSGKYVARYRITNV
jgi:hypothetical protein